MPLTDSAYVGLMWVESQTGLDLVQWDVFHQPEGGYDPENPVARAWTAAHDEESYHDVIRAGDQNPGPFNEIYRFWTFLRLASIYEPEEAWPTLMVAFGPNNSPRLVPADFAAEWVERVAELAPQLDEWPTLGSALVFIFQLAHKSGPLHGHPRALEAWKRLADLRDVCFDNLEGVEKADFAEQVCDQMSLAQDEAGLARWEALAEEAAREATPAPWNLTAEANWSDPDRIEILLHPEPPVDLHEAGPALEKYQQAAALSDRNRLEEGLSLYRSALQGFSPRTPAEELLHAMMLWGKATNLDRMGQLEASWQTLGEIFSPGKKLRLPLRFFVSWLQSSVIVAARSGRGGAAAVLLTLLYELVTRELPEAHEHLVDLFSELVSGTVEHLARPRTEESLAWLDEHGPRFSPDGRMPPPLLALRFELLTHLLRFEEANQLAEQMLHYARVQGDEDLEADWKEFQESAREQADDPYNLARLDKLGELEDVDAVGERGRTALMGAANAGNLALARRLLAQGADVNAEDPYDWTPLLLAADEGHSAMIRLLVEAGADLQAVTETDQTSLHLVAWQNHLEAARTLLELGVDPAACDQDGNTALHLAATEPVPEMIRLLVPVVGVDAENENTSGTPLMAAAASGLVENLKVLLELGADPKAQDADGETALDYARQHGREEAIMFLREGQK